VSAAPFFGIDGGGGEIDVFIRDRPATERGTRALHAALLPGGEAAGGALALLAAKDGAAVAAANDGASVEERLLRYFTRFPVGSGGVDPPNSSAATPLILDSRGQRRAAEQSDWMIVVAPGDVIRFGNARDRAELRTVSGGDLFEIIGRGGGEGQQQALLECALFPGAAWTAMGRPESLSAAQIAAAHPPSVHWRSDPGVDAAVGHHLRDLQFPQRAGFALADCALLLRRTVLMVFARRLLAAGAPVFSLVGEEGADDFEAAMVAAAAGAGSAERFAAEFADFAALGLRFYDDDGGSGGHRLQAFVSRCRRELREGEGVLFGTAE
jgi:hypothetical protein